MKKMNNQKLEKEIVQEVEKQQVPVNTEFIAKKVGVSWGRASRLLLALTVQGRIKAIPTLNGYIYCPMKVQETSEEKQLPVAN